jgi:hypothetical protein
VSRLDQEIGLAMEQKVLAPATGGSVTSEPVRLAQPFRVSIAHSSINTGVVGFLNGAVCIGSVLRDLGLAPVLAALSEQQDGGEEGEGAERTPDPQQPPCDRHQGNATSKQDDERDMLD